MQGWGLGGTGTWLWLVSLFKNVVSLGGGDDGKVGIGTKGHSESCISRRRWDPVTGQATASRNAKRHVTYQRHALEFFWLLG